MAPTGGIPASGSSWAEDIRRYESARRKEVNPGLLAGPSPRADVARASRTEEGAFNPVIQRYRSDKREQELTTQEEADRIRHLNRAMDVQLLRENPRSLINHTSKLDPLSQRGGPVQVPPRPAMPQSATDYNIVSNLPYDMHHWAAPGERPCCSGRGGGPRRVPAALVKDFDIITNRYRTEHEAKAVRDWELNALEATAKQRAYNRFNPVSQIFYEAEHEANMRVVEDARVAATMLQSSAQLPPSLRKRAAELYDLVSLEEKDPAALREIELAEEARKARYRDRYFIDEELRERGVQFEVANETQKLETLGPERRAQCIRHGYDIVTNLKFGEGPKCRPMQHFQYTKRSPWDKVMQDRSEEGDTARRRASTPRQVRESTQGSLPSVQSARRATPHHSVAPPAPAVPSPAIDLRGEPASAR